MRPTNIILNGILLGLVILLLMNSANAIIDYSIYLLEDETTEDMDIETITVDTNEYNIMKVNNETVMMFDDEGLIEDEDQIEDIFTTYYQAQFTPSEDELDSLEESIENFNASRNGLTRGLNAQDFCFSALYLNDYCTTEEDCRNSVSRFVGIMGSSGFSVDHNILVPAYLEYGTGLKGMDDNTEEALELIEDVRNNEGDLSTKMSELETAVEELENSADDLLDCEVFYHEDGSCPTCLGICFMPPIDYGEITEANEIINNITGRVEPLDDLNDTVQNIVDNSEQRKNYKLNKDRHPILSSKYKAIKNKYDGTLDEAEETLTYVINGKLVSNYNDANELIDKLDRQMTTYNFNNSTEAELTLLESKFKTIDNILEQNLTEDYKEANKAMEETTTNLIQARWYVEKTDEAQIGELNELGDEYNDYANDFDPPLTNTKYVELSADLNNLNSEIENVLERTPHSGNNVAAAVADVSKGSVNGVFSIVGAMSEMDVETKQDMAPIVPPLLLIVGDIALIAIAILIFVTIVHSKKYIFRKKIVLMSWTILLLMFIGVVAIGSIGIYNIIKDSTEEGNFKDFMDGVHESDDVAIVVDERGASATVTSAMHDCKDKVMDKLESKNVYEYTFSGDSCTIVNNGVTKRIDHCEDEIKYMPSIKMEYAPDINDYSFKSLYIYEFKIIGGASEYNKCEPAYAITLEE